MNPLPDPISQLATGLGRLPGIGPRSAERIALHLVQGGLDAARQLADTLVSACTQITTCPECGGLTERTPCGLCSDPRRDATVICVVERPVDILSIEKSGGFHGRYHVLGGRISPLSGVEPEDLRIDALESRLAGGGIAEVILALPMDVKGDATSYYLARRLARSPLKITRLAHGLPAGSGLEFADEITLTRSFEGRRELLP